MRARVRAVRSVLAGALVAVMLLSTAGVSNAAPVVRACTVPTVGCVISDQRTVVSPDGFQRHKASVHVFSHPFGQLPSEDEPAQVAINYQLSDLMYLRLGWWHKNALFASTQVDLRLESEDGTLITEQRVFGSYHTDSWGATIQAVLPPGAGRYVLTVDARTSGSFWYDRPSASMHDVARIDVVRS